MINSIPKGSSVAIQNNMPQLVQFYNYTMAMNGYNGSPQYIITDPYSGWFYDVQLDPGAITNMLTLVNQKLISGNYGILEEESGLILLEKNYKGSIKNFIPLKYITSNGQHINFIPPGNYTINTSYNITINSAQDNFIVESHGEVVNFTLNRYITGITVKTDGSGNFEILQV